jgi:hypothetical protein
MSWTYVVTDMLSTTAGEYTGSTVGLRTQIRFVIQDNQPARHLLDDAEIDWIQTQEMNQYMMAAACCEILVARAGNVKSKRVGDLSVDYDVEFYRGLAARLRARGLSYQVPYAGGVSTADKLAQEDDTDWVPSRIFRGIFDNARASQPTPGPTSTDRTGYPTT